MHLIQQMGHVALAVPNPEASARDLCEMVGLRVTARTAAGLFLSCNTRHREISFAHSATPHVLAVGLEAPSTAAVDEVLRRVRADGLDVIDDHPLYGGAERAVRFRAPGGVIFEMHTPIARSEPVSYVSRPKRIEHVNVLVPDVQAMADFLTGTLGLKLSDSAGDGMLSWYRAADGFHHTVAMGPGPGKLHHYAFDLRTLQDLSSVADTLAAHRRALIWGPGRHGAGGNVFTYYVDPDGCIVENSIEMARIDNDAVYKPMQWEIGEGMAGRWINLWGAGPPSGFGELGLPFA